MQPFKETNRFSSSAWPELIITKHQDHLLFYYPHLFTTVSNAVYGGGWKNGNHLINWQVPLHYHGKDPHVEIEQKIQEWNYPIKQSIGFQTAALLQFASIHLEAGDQFKMICCVTAGIGNKVRAGKKRKTYPAYQAGTINTFVFVDGKMTPSAMINAIITATEAKSAALQDLKIFDEHGGYATGTTTDATAISVTQSSLYEAIHLYAGSATAIGNSIGCLVYDAVKEALSYHKE